MWEYNYLEHDGQKGMHWGERQYQYPDGTYTPLGLQRRRAEYRAERRAARDAERRTVRAERREERRTIRAERRAERRTIRAEKRAEQRNVRSEERATRRRTAAMRGKLERMSDEQLRERTDRLNLENNYIQAMERRHSGQVYVRDTLRQIGRNAAVTVATKATGIAVDALVRQLGTATADLQGDFARNVHDAANAARAKDKD